MMYIAPIQIDSCVWRGFLRVRWNMLECWGSRVSVEAPTQVALDAQLVAVDSLDLGDVAGLTAAV